MNNQQVKKVVIAGGGTAGWITAALLSRVMGKTLDITLIESDSIPTVGVGEATIPPLQTLHDILGIDEKAFMAATNATFKLGIAFENWHNVGLDYIHSFGFAGRDSWVCKFFNYWLAGKQRGMVTEYGDYCTEHLAARQNKFAVLPRTGLNYAYHFDAGLYAGYLRKLSEPWGVKRHEGEITSVKLRESDGFIESLQLARGEVIEGDLFIDCTGFRALLIGDALGTGYKDWSHWLPCDRALAVQTESVAPPIPYTRSIAHGSGWQWRIPLQHRVGNGLVYSSGYMGDDEAHSLLLGNLEGKPITEPKPIRFRTGTRTHHWQKNCIAVGLSSGFLEPLESTSIHLIQRAVHYLIKFFPADTIRQLDIDEYNRQLSTEIEYIRDFIILHYKVTERNDTDFWNYCRTMSVPDSLASRIELFKETGRIFKHGLELFGEESWIQVMIGQGLMPKLPHAVTSEMNDDELSNFLSGIKEKVNKDLASLPIHSDFINYYCRSATAKSGMSTDKA
ncbi:tryptophan halogenase family protein [Marinimicrobium sp. ABcell2]|uniref:tryptophan halogenase family protein n=1 Tax=Marinimicrobium sp. ABcell2 TaxID=3069751 RepID=UPI0027B3D6AD|nr:tryptophan halogenase family protein [Marinimicrobium sp. ABcell2]MDQ2075881.1 tryptophan 7-halogenase [Marinimicrobium sp. ABcell2]